MTIVILCECACLYVCCVSIAHQHIALKLLLLLGGSYISIANNDPGSIPSAHQPLLTYGARIIFSHNTTYQTELLRLAGENKVRVVVDEVYPFTQEGVEGIFEKIKGGKSLGKNVLRIV